MYFSGIADEAGDPIEIQIKATKELGWKHIEARNVIVDDFEKGNIHDIPDSAFDALVHKLEDAGIKINCFGSTIGNWAAKIEDPFEPTLETAKRAIPRMQRLGTKLIRIMSFAIREAEDQMREERFKRLRELTKMFLDASIQPVHENCMNYGGLGWTFMLDLLENVPGLKVVYDTGNPVFNDDRTKPAPYPKQDPWEYYSHIREHIAHVHIKDAVWNPEKNDADYTYPGEGDGQIPRILEDLFANGYDAGISIEPHLAVVFHDASVSASPEQQYDTYVEYGRRLMKLVDSIKSG
ncbi:MAG: sugar phosphate isomerase/epimerase [Verrucomicrobia bacterium]|nr:sugar phosphate isomerase/epimerase [Verrucomicrobiota bacterium]MCF7707851.1 sugar phosphate isomerase/epimerase [Verrucomicrobiota bacterium]